MQRTQRDRPETGPFATQANLNRRRTAHVSRACNTCRRKKSKCDGMKPTCKSCAESGHDCTWTAEEDSRRPATKQFVESLKVRIADLEKQLESLGHQPTSSSNPVPPPLVQTTSHPFISVPQLGGHNSAGHSPHSWTSDLPSESSFQPDEASDVENIDDRLANAAGKLRLDEGGVLGLVGPSHANFHKPHGSPITRERPLEDGPKHELQIAGVAPDEYAPTHPRSRSASQTRSRAHSRASSSSAFSPAAQLPPHHISPDFQTPSTFGPASPGNDITANFANPAPEVDLAFLLTPQPTNPSPGPTLIDHDEYNWARFLPPDVSLTRQDHDTLIDTFFKFFSSWCFRTNPDLFLRDMRAYLAAVAKRDLDGSSKQNDISVSPTAETNNNHILKVSKTVHYTPMLHNAILALALAYSDNRKLSQRRTRVKFIERAKLYLDDECAIPSLACVHALSYISSYYSGEGEQTLGFLYFGMSVRMSQVLGLSIDCSAWVRSGKITKEDEQDRIWTFWSTYCLDKCWAFYVGRDLGLPAPLIKHGAPQLVHADSDQSQGSTSSVTNVHHNIRYPDVDQDGDNLVWKWKAPNVGDSLSNHRLTQNVPNIYTAAFEQCCKLMVLASKVMSASWSTLPDPVSTLALEVDGWLEDLPDSMRITRPKTCQSLPHVLMLNLAHQWLQILLHRPFYRGVKAKDPSVKRCDAGAEKIIQYLQAWRRLYNLKYVPITAVQIAYIAGTTCLLKAVQSVSAPGGRKGALDNVRECIRALNEMGATWSSAKQSASSLKLLLKEQTTAQEFSPMPSRNPTVEVMPPSVGPSRMGTIDMTIDFMGDPGLVLGTSGQLHAEPQDDGFGYGIPGHHSESPVSNHSPVNPGHQFLPTMDYGGGAGPQFGPSLDVQPQLNPSMNPLLRSQGVPSNQLHQQLLHAQFQQHYQQQQQQQQQQQGNILNFPQFEHIFAGSGPQLRAGETFPGHPTGHFGVFPGPQSAGATNPNIVGGGPLDSWMMNMQGNPNVNQGW